MSGAPPAATPERLTATLRRAGVLGEGEVVGVVVEMSRDTLVSHIARLRLVYAPTDNAAPSHVFLKTSRDDIDERLRQFGAKEVAFWTGS